MASRIQARRKMENGHILVITKKLPNDNEYYQCLMFKDEMAKIEIGICDLLHVVNPIELLLFLLNHLINLKYKKVDNDYQCYILLCISSNTIIHA